MEDKDFLGYFGQLGPPATAEGVKAAAHKIVNTLVALSTVSGRRGSTDSASKALEAAEESIKKRY